MSERVCKAMLGCATPDACSAEQDCLLYPQKVAPPTPDLDAVVARVAEKLTRVTSSDCRTSHYFEMRNTDGAFVAAIHEDDLHTLLAAVSRPAEARGEPVAWGLRDKTTGRINAARGQRVNAEEIRDQLLAQRIDVEVVPLYAHPAPSGGEADVDSDEFRDNCALQVICRAFDNWEPIYERWLAYDKTQWLWWGRALGAFLRREIAAAPRPETGDTP